MFHTLVRILSEPHLSLEISDNGIGFDLGTVPAGRYGLTGMAERAELVGAELMVESELGEGTRVRMEIGESA